MATTPERVRGMGKELVPLTDDQLNMYIEDASLEVSSLTVPEEHKERLTRYLAAHLAFMSMKRVVKEKLDVIERQYSDSASAEGLNSTPYGQEYLRLVSNLSGSSKRPKLNLVVL